MTKNAMTAFNQEVVQRVAADMRNAEQKSVPDACCKHSTHTTCMQGANNAVAETRLLLHMTNPSDPVGQQGPNEEDSADKGCLLMTGTIVLQHQLCLPCAWPLAHGRRSLQSSSPPGCGS